jgi:hypothetical protein
MGSITLRTGWALSPWQVSLCNRMETGSTMLVSNLPLKCKQRLIAHLVRDEGVAGSNPATPTTFLNLRSPTRPVMRNETRPVIPLNPFAALRRSNEKELREFAGIKFESFSTEAELHVFRHLETFPHVHDPELARSPTVFGTHSRGHLGRFLTDFLFAP